MSLLNINIIKKQLEKDIEKENKLKEKMMINLELDDYLSFIKEQIEYKKVCLLSYKYWFFIKNITHFKEINIYKYLGGHYNELKNPLFLIENFGNSHDNYQKFYNEYNNRMSMFEFNDLFNVKPKENIHIIKHRKKLYDEYFNEYFNPFIKDKAFYKSLKIINERLNKIEEKLGI